MIPVLTRRIKHEIETDPPWLRWLEASAPAAYAAGRQVRRTFFFYQLPLLIFMAGLVAIFKSLSFFDAYQHMTLWLTATALIVLLWPVLIARLGSAAYRGITAAPPRYTNRLRGMTVLCFLFVTMNSLLIASLLGLTMLITLGAR